MAEIIDISQTVLRKRPYLSHFLIFFKSVFSSALRPRSGASLFQR